MASATIALVPMGHPVPQPGQAVAFTGSSSEYWALAAAQQQEYDRAAREEKQQLRLRRQQRLLTILYNVLSVAELVYFIVGLYMVQWQVADLEENPLLGPGAIGIIKLGGTHTQRIVQRRQYWRLLSSLFHSAGAIHLAANLSLVWTFGHFLVREVSAYIVAFIFLASGLAGVIFSANIGAEHMTAAGSIPAFGLAGAACALLVFRWRSYTCHAWTAAVVAFLLGLNAFIGATPFVDNSGNTAGFVFGGLLGVGFMLVRTEQADGKSREVLLYGGAAAACTAVLAAIIGGLIGLQLEAPAGGCCNQWVCSDSAWWSCDASRIWPTTCTYTTYLNGTSLLACPKGDSVNIGLVNGTVGAAQLQTWCDTFCNLLAPGTDPGTGSGGGTARRRR